MNRRQAKRLLVGGLAAMVAALLVEVLNTQFIAAAGVIVLTIALLVGGAAAVAVAIVWYIMHPMRRA